MALDITVGGGSSNSYATLAETATYLEWAYTDIPSAWDNIDDLRKDFCLQIGALLMNGMKWRGAKACRNQRLAFPRWWRWDDAYPDDEDTYLDYSDIDASLNPPVVDDEIKYAQIEISYQMVYSGILQMAAMDFPEREIKAFGLGGSLNIEFFQGAIGKAKFNKANLQSLDIAHAWLEKWVLRIAGAVV